MILSSAHNKINKINGKTSPFCIKRYLKLKTHVCKGYNSLKKKIRGTQQITINYGGLIVNNYCNKVYDGRVLSNTLKNLIYEKPYSSQFNTRFSMSDSIYTPHS